MATNTTVTSNYVGKKAGEIIGQAFKEGDSLSKKLVTMLPNVGFKLNLRKIAYTDGTTAYACGHTPAGAISLTEKVLQPIKLKNDISVCKEDFRATWSEELLGASASNPNAPSDIMEAIQLEVLKSTAERTDNLIWNGDGNNSDEWDGFITLWGSDGDVIKAGNGLTSQVTAVTKANVDDCFDVATGAIPYAMRRQNLKMVVSPDVFDKYMKYLIENGASAGFGGNANTQAVYGRYVVESCNGLPDNTICIYDPKNLVFGTGLLADHNELSLVDEDTIPLMTGLIRGKMVYSGGCQYYNGEDIVWYLTTASN
jgi:hypothetical protein